LDTPKEYCEDLFDENPNFELWSEDEQETMCIEVYETVTDSCDDDDDYCDACAILMADIYQTYENFINDLYSDVFQDYESTMFDTLEAENKLIQSELEDDDDE
jgi:hypothetical protein